MFFDVREIDEAIVTIRSAYQRVCEERDSLRKRLDEYDKDAEIKRLTEMVRFSDSHALHSCTELEQERIKKFRAKHFNSCRNPNKYTFDLIGSGFGEMITIKCPKCGECEDVTDDSAW